MSSIGNDTVEQTTQAPLEVQDKRQARRRRLIEWLIVIVAAVIVALGLRAYAFQAFFVPSGSMIPTLQVGDRIIVDKFLFDYHNLHSGDIIVFHTPAAAKICGDADDDLVKRVIGLPGQTISSSPNGDIYINGKVLPEPYLPPNTPFGPQIRTQTIPQNDYFVMGDNRGISCDSRYWGYVSGPTIIGKVVLLVWRGGHPAFHWF